MSKRQVTAQRNRVIRLFRKWKVLLGLTYWDFYYNFVLEDHEDSTPGQSVLMGVDSSWEYQTAAFYIYPAALTRDDDDLEESIVHELCHAVVCELRPADRPHTDAERKHEERVVTNMARAYIRVHRTNQTKKEGTTNGSR